MSALSFDYLVGACEQRGRHDQPERLGGLEIDHQLELGGLQEWQVRGLGTFQNSTSVDAGLTVLIDRAGSVAHQTASCGELAPTIDRWYCMERRQGGEFFASVHEDRIVGHYERANPFLNQRREGRVEIAFGADVQHKDVLPNAASCPLQVSNGRAGSLTVRVDQQRDQGCRSRQLAQQLQPFWPER